LRKLVYLTRILGILIIVMVMSSIVFADDKKSGITSTKIDEKEVENDKDNYLNKEENKEANKEENKEDNEDDKSSNENKTDNNTNKENKMQSDDTDAKKKNYNSIKNDDKKKDEKKAKKANQKVSVDISGCIKSEEIANKLQSAGVIKDSKDFNKFLVDNKYDSNIRTGKFVFEKNMDYVEIRNILIKEEYR